MTEENKCPTDFASGEGFSPEEIASESAELASQPLLKLLIDSVPDIILILNNCRQIVFMNRQTVQLLEITAPEELYGQRTGELFGCAHAFDNPGGCGTGEFCKFCGALHAVLNAIGGAADVQECQMARRDGTSLDLRVWTTPMQLCGRNYTIFVARDISDEKRRHVLERIFFHDILNTAGGIKGISEIIRTTPKDQLDELLVMIESASNTLVEEIRAQKDLLSAENGELKLHLSEFYSRQVLTDVVSVYEKHETAVEKNISIASDAEDFMICSDSRLLKRVVGNMTKNALEASNPEETIVLSVRKDGDMSCFSVWNPAFMPEEVQKQVFKRSFSTKGYGRGIGTWSVKLLTETYLQGQVSFSSTPEDGTFFFAEIPDLTE